MFGGNAAYVLTAPISLHMFSECVYYFFFQLHLGDNTLDIAAKASTLRLTMTHSVAPLWLVLKRKDPAGDAERTAPKGAAASVAMRKWSMALQVRFADVFLQMRSNGCASECV